MSGHVTEMTRLGRGGIRVLQSARSGSSGTHTVTLSAKQQRAQERAAQNSKVGQPPLPAPPPNTTYLIKCGAGVTTNGSCVFAARVARAFRAAERTYGKPPTGVP